MADELVLSIDQGTTSSRALAFERSGKIRSVAQQEFRQIFPADGWVEHDADEIWQTTLEVCRAVMDEEGPENFRGIGITNQRETAVIWDRKTDKPIANAIVWQDRRTADLCAKIASGGHEEMVREKTGLLLDPYFSASKIAWLLDNVPDARARAEAGDLAFGTVDSWLVWQLTAGQVHATDATNAARTSIFNIHTHDWDDELLALFNVPRNILPTVHDNISDFGVSANNVLPANLPICGMAGDQQAAVLGQACFDPGMIKSTYGTGCFVLANTGTQAVTSQNRLLTTIAYRLDGRTIYGLEGSIFMAGAIVQWLRDALCLIEKASDTAALAAAADPFSKIVLVPAFTGLGAPHWKPDARAALFNMTRDTGRPEIARAALEAVSLQTDDLLRAINDDMAHAGLSVPPRLRVDGGMVANDWFVQNLADLCACPIDRPEVIETTAAGAAMLAMVKLGWYDSPADFAASWKLNAAFEPSMPENRRAQKQRAWQGALEPILRDAETSSN
tara:strand:- start:1667 stop:3178 length:1512 start_codon:yes stop_codon:yes gene_type:complete